MIILLSPSLLTTSKYGRVSRSQTGQDDVIHVIGGAIHEIAK